jgi:hypothetical protein
MPLFQETFSIILHFPGVRRVGETGRSGCAFRAREYGPRRNFAWNLIRDEC